MVFQQYNLWPHLTVKQNLIEAPCRVLGLEKDRAHARADKLLERLRPRLTPIVFRYSFPAASSSASLSRAR